jgi:LmbE family N-acetylglucosaminyl deacetylase
MTPIAPLLESERTLNILFVGAHSDDIEIGCGATILQLVGRRPDSRIHWMVLSAAGEREAEASRSASEITDGVEELQTYLHAFRDGYFPQVYGEIKEILEQLKKRLNPDLIFTHYRQDLHQDHKVVSEITWNTFRDHLILEYEIPKYDGDLGSPNVFVSVSEQAMQKKSAHLLEHFSTQRSRHWFSEEVFTALMRIRGVESRSSTGYAEGFYVRKAVMEI